MGNRPALGLLLAAAGALAPAACTAFDAGTTAPPASTVPADSGAASPIPDPHVPGGPDAAPIADVRDAGSSPPPPNCADAFFCESFDKEPLAPDWMEDKNIFGQTGFTSTPARSGMAFESFVVTTAISSGSARLRRSLPTRKGTWTTYVRLDEAPASTITLLSVELNVPSARAGVLAVRLTGGKIELAVLRNDETKGVISGALFPLGEWVDVRLAFDLATPSATLTVKGAQIKAPAFDFGVSGQTGNIDVLLGVETAGIVNAKAWFDDTAFPR